MPNETSSTEDVTSQNNETTQEVTPEANEEVTAEAEETVETESRENARIRELNEEKKALSRALDLITQRQQPVQQTVTEDPEEEIDPAVAKKLQRELAKKDQQYGAVVTSMGEKLDDLESKTTVPNYEKNKSKIESYKDEYYQKHGRWISRWQAYANLVAMGELEAPVKEKKKTPVKVNREQPRVVTETKSNSGGKQTSAKAFKDMSIAEKEAYLENKPF